MLLNLGAALSRKGDPLSAMAAWKRAAMLDPLASDAFFDMGYAELHQRMTSMRRKRTCMESLKLRGRDSEALVPAGPDL